MESMNNNSNNQLFLSEFKELRKEVSSMKKRIVQLEESHQKQQERLDILERENHILKTELNNINGNKAVASVLKRKRTDQVDEERVHEEKIESKLESAKKTKTHHNNNNNDDEAVVLPRHENDDSFDSLSDDLLHKIVEFNGNCFAVFGSINKRCKNLYDVEEYKLKKHTCVFGYGTIEMMLQHYLQKRKEGTLNDMKKVYIGASVIYYNRLDAIDWIIQLGDFEMLQVVCLCAALLGRINFLTQVFCKSNLTMLDQMLNDVDLSLCYNAVYLGKLETLKWLRNHGCSWNARTFVLARDKGHDEILQYLRAEGCPEQDEDTDESSGNEQVGSDDEDEDGDY